LLATGVASDKVSGETEEGQANAASGERRIGAAACLTGRWDRLSIRKMIDLLSPLNSVVP
jgi:hypothetical protein